MIKLISLDLDGTLLDSNRKISERNRNALQMAKQKGADIVISTGSPYSLLPRDELAGIDVSYAITANGSAIYNYKTGECLYEKSVGIDKIVPVLEFLLSKDIHIDMFMGGKAYCPSTTKQIVQKLSVPQSRKDYILKNARFWVDDVIGHIYEHQLTVQKITINFYLDENGEMVDKKEIKKYLETKTDLKIVSGGWGNLELTRSDVDKGCALKWLCEKIGVSIMDTVAMGDSLNDLDVIQAAGIGVAMKNAMPEVLSAADYVTSSNDECGVAEYIDIIMNKSI